MSLITRLPRGTQDVLPEDSFKWQIAEQFIKDCALYYGFSEIRTPVFEHTELFLRSVGDTTDVVQKEMYTFNDKANRSITLRPEGTASTVRAFLEHGIYNSGLPSKLFYFDSCYRYEKPQSGRLREFHQFGAELFGAQDACADAEIILLANRIFSELGIDRNISLEINSIGCPLCRKNYQNALINYFKENLDSLCHTCKERLDKNPMRILDCKNPDCKAISENAPVILDFLCNDCQNHFDEVKSYLDNLNIKYIVNPKIVRGLDYYTRTVFEFIYPLDNVPITVCGGGRYDGLISELGGKPTPALGFGLGLERLIMIAQNDENSILSKAQAPTCDLYVIAMDKNFKLPALKLCEEVRNGKMSAQCDLLNKSLKAQMKYADKIGASFTTVIGENEIKNQKAIVKNMTSKETFEISIGDDFLKDFSYIYSHSL